MSEEANSCVFCKIIRGEIKKDPFIVGDKFVAFEDIKPVRPGHMLVVPKGHYETLLDIPNDKGIDMLKFCKEIAQKQIDEGKGKGFNIVMNNHEVAGQVIPHAHLHIIPRDNGDGICIVG